MVEKYTYDAFGQPTILSTNNTQLSTSALNNQFLFEGAMYVPEAELYDMRNRFYHPNLGRFMQSDPVGLQVDGEKLSAEAVAYFWAGKAPEKWAATELNTYRYCGNDPVDGSDPLGLELSVVQSLSQHTMIVTDTETGKSFTLRVTSGNNSLGSVSQQDVGPVPLGTYSIYERPQPHQWGDTRAFILDSNDSKPHNDTNDDGSRETGKERFGFRYHVANERLPNRGSKGCNVSDKKSLDKFAKAADKTRKGPARTINSPKTRPGDGLPPDRFVNLPRVGTWEVKK